MEYLLCIGDSLTFGARDEYFSSYPLELARIFWEKEKKEVFCVNHSENGITSSELAPRIYSISKSCPEAKAALLVIGTNDTQVHTTPEIYRENLRQIITVLETKFKHIGIGFLPPIIGPGLPAYPKNAQEQAEIFNKIIGDIAKSYGCFTADFSHLGRYVIDTVHFNHEGYVKMAETWYEALRKDGVMKD